MYPPFPKLMIFYVPSFPISLDFVPSFPISLDFVPSFPKRPLFPVPLVDLRAPPQVKRAVRAIVVSSHFQPQGTSFHPSPTRGTPQQRLKPVSRRRRSNSSSVDPICRPRALSTRLRSRSRCGSPRSRCATWTIAFRQGSSGYHER